MQKRIIGEVDIDIENAKTQKVITLTLPIIDYKAEHSFEFDVSNLTKEEYILLQNAINPELKYTDIELFYVSMENGLFNYGDDYSYHIENGKLKGIYIRNKLILKGGKNK
ncbi:MAG: hypothetical protein IJD92_01640 [Bacilli bacterium]|nr:hypothetical protein [Bacilli bacterium]